MGMHSGRHAQALDTRWRHQSGTRQVLVDRSRNTITVYGTLVHDHSTQAIACGTTLRYYNSPLYISNSGDIYAGFYARQ
jgi:hypothetical protein